METSLKKERLILGKCQKCSERGQEVRLLGGYNGVFCNGHLNEWHELIFTMLAFSELAVAYNSRDGMARGGVANKQSRDCTRKIIDLEDHFYHKGKEWAEGSDLVREKAEGLYHKYNLSKISGEPIDPKAFYFPLRLDKDRHARKAARVYANSVTLDNITLARELHDLLDGIEHDLTKQNEIG